MHQKRKIGIVAAVVVFFCVAGLWYTLGSRPEAEENSPEKDKVESVFLETGMPTAGTAAPTGCASTTPTKAPAEDGTLSGQMFVYICGAVAKPGVYEMPEGSRLFEAVLLAGGCLPEADEAYHNLAREVFDGERVYILSKEESEQLSLKERVDGEQTAPGGNSGDTAISQEKSIVNLNTATIAQLMTLPGIGESRAEDIIAYRSKVGQFLSIEEIKNVSGIGEAMFERIKDRITVE